MILVYIVGGLLVLLIVLEVVMRLFHRHLSFLYKFLWVRSYFDGPFRKFLYPPKMIARRSIKKT